MIVLILLSMTDSMKSKAMIASSVAFIVVLLYFATLFNDCHVVTLVTNTIPLPRTLHAVCLLHCMHFKF